MGKRDTHKALLRRRIEEKTPEYVAAEFAKSLLPRYKRAQTPREFTALDAEVLRFERGLIESRNVLRDIARSGEPCRTLEDRTRRFVAKQSDQRAKPGTALHFRVERFLQSWAHVYLAQACSRGGL